MPLAITIATCAAIVFYISCNVAYLTVLPLDVMKESTAVALVGQSADFFLSLTFLTCLTSFNTLSVNTRHIYLSQSMFLSKRYPPCVCMFTEIDQGID